MKSCEMYSPTWRAVLLPCLSDGDVSSIDEEDFLCLSSELNVNMFLVYCDLC